MISTIQKNINEFLHQNKKPLLILIQGCTCSGKTTFANYLHAHLEKVITTTMISLDNYYKQVNHDYFNSEITSYDFDNPKAFEWNNLSKTLKGYINKDDIIFKYNYDFNKSLSTEYKVKNTYPKIIILEGLYSFNLFSDNKFDLTKLNPYKSALEYDDVPLELNDASLRNQFITLKIMLTMNKDDIKNILLYRNANYRNSDDVTHNFNTILINKFNHYIWPATEKWGLLGKKEADVIIVGGTRNKKDIKIVTNAILTPFNYKDQLITFEKFIDH